MRKNNYTIGEGGEEKYRALFDNAPVAISVNSDRKVVEANKTLERIIRINDAGFRTGLHFQRRYLHGDETEFSVLDLPGMCALNENKPVLDIEMGIAEGNNILGWTLVSAAPVDLPD